MYTKKFKGKINDKNIYDMTSNLDYSKNTAIERVEEVNNLCENGLNDWVNEYTEEHYEPVKKGNSQLSEDDTVNQRLEKLADYILFSEDIRDSSKVKSHRQIDLIHSKESPLEFKKQNNGNPNGDIDISILNNDIADTNGEAPDFQGNYKKERKQKILNEDYERSKILKEYKALFDATKESSLDWYKKKSINKNIKADMLIAKDMLFGTIYFKRLLPDTHNIESIEVENNFDFFDKHHVRLLLQMKNKGLGHWGGYLVKNLDDILKKIGLSDVEKEVLDALRIEEIKNDTERAFVLGITQQRFVTVVSQIVNKVIEQNNTDYINWLHLNHIKGKWKKCKKCGEIKLTRYFHKDNKGIMGARSSCKLCELKSKKAKTYNI